jgi:hypothetical protein
MFFIGEQCGHGRLLRIFSVDAITRTRDVCDAGFGVLFIQVSILHNNILVCQLDQHKLVRVGIMQTELGSGQLFMHHIDNDGPETYSELGPQLSKVDRVGPTFGQDV